MEMSYREPESKVLLRDNRLNGATIVTANNRRSGNDGMGYEKTPFLPSEPVRLTPAWESNNLPNDTLNLKNIPMDMAPPVDRLNLIYITLVLHGLGTLMPWNMFITAKTYFVVHKLGKDSIYAANFLAFVGFAAQVPNVIFNWLNIFIPMGGNLTTRIIWSLSIEVLMFVVTVVLAMVDSSEWRAEFFWLTMASVVVLNIFNGVFQNTVYGVAARLPSKYTGAVVLGSNASGVLTSLLSMLATYLAPSERTAAVYYFLTALFILLACFDTYFALPLNRFYRYHERLTAIATTESQMTHNTRTPYWLIFKQASVHLFNVFFIFFVTLTIFPAIHSDIKPSEEGFFIGPKIFTDITCYLTFNVGAALGSFTATFIPWPTPKYLIVAVLLRAFFIPAFLICNYRPLNWVRTMPVLIHSDWAYWTLAWGMAITSGHLSSLAMMYVGKTVSPSYSATAGMFGAACLMTGILSGVLFSMVGPPLVSWIFT